MKCLRLRAEFFTSATSYNIVHMQGAFPQEDSKTKPVLACVHDAADAGTAESRITALRDLLGEDHELRAVSLDELKAAVPPLSPGEAGSFGEIALIILDLENRSAPDNLGELFPRRPVILFEDPLADNDNGPGDRASPGRREPLLTLRRPAAGALPESGLLRGAVDTALEYWRQVERNHDLTRRLARMNSRLESLVESRARRVAGAEDQEKADRRSAIIEQELDKARKIQSAVLPRSIPEPRHLSISTLYLPLDKIGGDFYGFVEFGNGDLGIYIADVSGHGIPAAFIAAMVKLQFDQTAPFLSSPAETLVHLNESLQDRTGGHFLTIFYAIIRKHEHRLTYARAGHCSPYLHRKSNDTIHELNSRGRMLGVFPELRSTDTEIDFGPNDRLVLYTDGILESRNPRNPPEAGSEIFGEDRLRETILNGGHETGYDFIDLIMADVEEFSGIPYFEDDVTLMVVDRSR